jgi:hypothetical protein
MQVIKPMQTSKTANTSLFKFNVEIKIRLTVNTYDSRAVIFSFQVKIKIKDEQALILSTHSVKIAR